MSTSTVSSCPVLITPSIPGMVYNIVSRDVYLNNGVPICAGLLNGEVVAGTRASFVGAGHDPHPAPLTLLGARALH